MPNLTIITLLKGPEEASSLMGTFESLKELLGPKVRWLLKTNGSFEVPIPVSDWVSIYAERDVSFANAANQALGRIGTGYFMMIGSDDRVIANNLRSLLDAGVLDKNFGLIAGACHIQSQNSIMKPNVERILSHMTVPFPSCLVSVDAAMGVGGFNLIYRIACDYDLLVRLVKSGTRVAITDSVLSYFGEGGMSETHQVEGVVEMKLSKYRNGIINKFELCQELKSISNFA